MGEKMTESKFLVCVAEALELELDQISLNTSAEDLEVWDSLGHLTILFALDKASGGKASKIDGLSSMTKLNDIFQALSVD
jgi:acyl carrier protein